MAKKYFNSWVFSLAVYFLSTLCFWSFPSLSAFLSHSGLLKLMLAWFISRKLNPLSLTDRHWWRVSMFDTCPFCGADQRLWVLVFVSVWCRTFLWPAVIFFFPDLHVMMLTSTCVSTVLGSSSVGLTTSVSWKSKLQLEDNDPST